jgi:prepilin signal peptidase PulO-like enzyme (type II secretory pathway)
VQLQHHARHRLPTYRLIFLHVVESLVFVPIMIGILFFLFEFFDDQLLAFMVLTLVWLCELFTMISVRTSLSMQYFPRFFFLYFMVFHIYFFSYTYGIISQYALFQMHVQVCCPQFYVFKAFFSSLLLLPTIAKHVECFSNNCEVAGNL